jgi:aldehyde dehydrogenase (NAD+)
MSTLRAPEGERRNLIDGALLESRSGETFENLDPSTEEVLGVTADGTREDMRAAVAAARRAFDQGRWAGDPALRQRCLLQLIEALRADRENLRSIVVHEAGSPVLLTYHVQCDFYLDAMPYWADLAVRYPYEQGLPDLEFMGRRSRRLVLREPAGVVGAITPWNFPLYLNLCKLGPALASGCTVVLKPAPDTPWSATRIGRLIAERTEIPPGVVNIVASSDHQVGEVLSSDPRVDLITFTGSTATGRRIMERASASVKRVFLELGGKSANIVLDDADPAVIAGAAAGMCDPDAAPAAALALRGGDRDRARRHGAGRLRRSKASQHAAGAADQRPPARARARLHGEGTAGGGAPAARGRRSGTPPARILRGAHPVRGRRSGGHHRAGGDLRPRARRDPLR